MDCPDLLDSHSEVHRILHAIDSELPWRVADLVRGRHPLDYLARAVSGTFDVDRCDYLLRDAHFTGVGYSRIPLPSGIILILFLSLHDQPLKIIKTNINTTFICLIYTFSHFFIFESKLYPITI